MSPMDVVAERVDLVEFMVTLLARTTFPAAGTGVTLGVSGGADSSALLVLAVAGGCDVTVVHVDHGLRPESADEVGVVEQLAARYGARFRSVRAVVAPGPNLEARARAARLGAMPPDALLGHTADDQAETVLLGLLRGSGLDGLSAMSPDRHPILGLRRAETHALCASEGIEPVHDATNGDLTFRRNRVRAELMPLAQLIAERDLVPVLCRQADLLRDEAALLDELAAQIDVTDALALANAPLALARRAVRRWLADPYPPDAASVERVLRVARGDVQACELHGGRRVSRHAQRLSVSSP
jgi:tRNA(Ile)-lysidine synthase